MKKWMAAMIGLFAVTAFAASGFAKDFTGKKVLYIDSYHQGYAWSDGITRGVEKVLDGTGVELKVFRMDTKRNKEDAFKQEAARKAKALIETYQPDVVIASDDNASKFLIQPYFEDADLPFVFCGVNWDATVYGYPYANATGMVEVTPIPQIIEQLKPYARGDRIGFLAPELLTARKESKNYREVFGFNDMVEYYAEDFEDWKKGFLELQETTDMVIIDSDGGLYDDKTDEMKAFVEANTKVPTGAAYDFMAPATLFVYGKVAEEQGAWSAETALKILEGTSPGEIPLVKNKQGNLIINTRIARALGAEIPFDILESAEQVIE
jgi:ABC-type uncharacterized transport system substrate-binding protein